MPKVSVLMSVYNDARDLPAAIESILGGSFADFEFIIINDASTDDSPAILQDYAQRDSRIILLHNAQNIGLTRSLNRGLERCTGEFIARLDSNDLALPDRLAHQVDYLHRHPEIGLLSGDWHSIDERGNPIPNERTLYHEPAGHLSLAWSLLWNNPIAHISVMMRRAVLTQHAITYRPEHNGAEDYELWGTLSRVTRLARLAKIYVQRRVILSGISFVAPEKQLGQMYQVFVRENRAVLGESISESALLTLFDLIHRPANQTKDYRAATDHLVRAYHHFRNQAPPTEDLRQIQGEAVGYLLRIARRAETRTTRWYALQGLRTVSSREFFSRNTFALMRT